jgi:broad specificity phosphatase PhoE
VTRLVLARHGQTSYNAERRFQGWRDIPLDDMGRVQAQALAQALRGRSFARLLASDLVRARETAEAISQAVNVPVEVDRRLRECGFGEWQGLALAEVRERWPEEYREWVEKGTPAPGGESYQEVRTRVGGLIDELLSAHPSSDLLIVSHSGAIKMLIGHCLGIGIAACRRFRLAEGSLCELDHSPTGGWRLSTLNRVPD